MPPRGNGGDSFSGPLRAPAARARSLAWTSTAEGIERHGGSLWRGNVELIRIMGKNWWLVCQTPPVAVWDDEAAALIAACDALDVPQVTIPSWARSFTVRSVDPDHP